MFKKSFALILALAVIMMSLPVSIAVSAAEQSGSVDAVNYLIGDVIYQNDFDGETVGKLPDGWSAGHPSGWQTTKTDFGWAASNGYIPAAKVVEHDTFGKVVEFTASNTDAFMALPATDTIEYIFEAEVIPNSGNSLGIAGNFYGATYEASGVMYGTYNVGSSAFKCQYRGTGGEVTNYSLPLAPTMSNVLKFKIISFNGNNYIYCNNSLVGVAPWRTPTGASDNPGFYTYSGSMYIKNVKVTEIFSTTKHEATRIIVNDDSSVDLQTEFSFDKQQSIYKSYFDGDYSYSSNAKLKLGVATVMGAQDVSDSLTVNTAGAQTHYFSSDEYEQDDTTVSISLLSENINSADWQKYINFRPFTYVNGQYYYGQGVAFKMASLANGAYLSATEDGHKAKLDELFGDYSEYVVGVNAEDITFTLFSDFHYKQDMYPNSIADLREILKRADQSNSSLVLSGGDFTNDMKGSPELYNTFLNYYTEEGELLPALNVYGNHEMESAGNTMDVVTPTLTNAENAVWGDGTVGHDPQDNSYGYYYVDIDGFRFICLDDQYSYNTNHINGVEVGWEHSLEGSYGPPNAAINATRGFDEGDAAVGNTQNYALGDVQMAWLEKVAIDAAEKDIPCIMISHLGYYPISVNGGGSGGTEIRAIMEKANAINPGTFAMGINGHFHTSLDGWDGDMFLVEVNTVRNVHTDGPASNHYTDEHTYMYEQYDSKGNLLSITERPLNELYWSKQCWYSADPLSYVVHLNTAGIVEIEGVQSDWWYGVEPGIAQQLKYSKGTQPYVEDKLYSDCDVFGHAETLVADQNGHHIECRAYGCRYKSGFISDHKYTNKAESKEFLAGDTICSGDTYYYSCDCGATGTATFKAQTAHGHDADTLWQSNSTHHWQTCNDCGGKANEGTHKFDRQIATSNFKAKATECPATSEYYYSCLCGKKGSETFVYSNPALHDKQDEWLSDSDTHWHSCSKCEQRVYEAPHTYNVQNKTDRYIAAGPDGDGLTTYYYACVCGAKGTETYKAFVARAGDVWNGVAYAPASGSGTQSDPYLISVAQELAWVAGLSEIETKNKYYEITHDIVLNDPQNSYDSQGYVKEYDALSWPSGKSDDHSLENFGTFAGTLDGGGHKIIGLYNDYAPDGYWGLFGSLASGATVRNVNIESAFYKRGDQAGTQGTSNSYAAGIAGSIAGSSVTIEHCTVYKSAFTETAAGWANVSGIIGASFAYSGISISNCGTDFVTNVDTDSSRAGYNSAGILGENISNVKPAVTVSGCWSNRYPCDSKNTTESRVSFKDCYSLSNAPSNLGVAAINGITTVSDSVKGDAAKTTMPKLFWGEAWQTVVGENPVPTVYTVLYPTGISIPEKLSVRVGTKQAIEATILPEGINDTIVWKSSNLSVALVNSDGVITPYQNGVTTVTASLKEHPHISATCEVLVYGGTLRFPDTDKSGWYYDAVSYAVGMGILKGYDNGYFGTADGIQRQDFLVMLARYDGVDLSIYNYTTGQFADVAKNSYYEAAVNWGYENGIVTGYQNGLYGVGDTITREQIVTFFYRYAAYKGINTEVSAAAVNGIKDKYEDFGSVSEFAKTAALWAIDRGVISGKTATTIVPQGEALRCEVAKIMYNIYQNEIFG